MYVLGAIEMLALSFPDVKICTLDGPTLVDGQIDPIAVDELPTWTMRFYGFGVLIACSLAVNGGVKCVRR